MVMRNQVTSALRAVDHRRLLYAWAQWRPLIKAAGRFWTAMRGDHAPAAATREGRSGAGSGTVTRGWVTSVLRAVDHRGLVYPPMQWIKLGARLDSDVR